MFSPNISRILGMYTPTHGVYTLNVLEISKNNSIILEDFSRPRTKVNPQDGKMLECFLIIFINFIHVINVEIMNQDI